MDKKKVPQKKPDNKKRLYKNLGFAVIVALFVGVFLLSFNKPAELAQKPYNDVMNRANRGEISKLVVSGEKIEVTLNDQDKASEVTRGEAGSSIYGPGGLTNRDVSVEFKEASSSGATITALLINLLPVIIIVGVLIFLLRSAQGQGNQALGFGKSSARLYGNEKEVVKFNDVAGNDEAKVDLQEVVEFLKFPKKFQAVGARIPKGVLLVGPPGTGKTMMARAVAGEANVPFFSISGSEFVEMFVGVGASRVRDLFSKAKKNAPCIIFVDEIDAVGRRRGSGMGGGHDEREQTLNQILVEMDGFEQGQNVIVLAATNRMDVLDPALLRPGRFDRRVAIGLPDRKDRLEILKVHFSKKPLQKGVDLESLAAKTAGSSGADLANIANEAAIVAARQDRTKITEQDITEAFEKVAIGPERKSKVMSEKEKELTAYHEAGHAIVGHVLPDSDMVHKVTIIPRGGTGGVTWFIPPEDKSYHSIIEYKDVLARMLGGRIAEEVIYGTERVTTGAGNDLQKAAELARDMVVNQGMGKQLRDQVFHVEGGMMLDRLVSERQYSDDTAKIIDDEVEALITEAAHRARVVIRANKQYLDSLKDALLEKETVEAEEVIKLLSGSTMPSAAALY
ncbi:MAG TPA: ATP-dependent zinc metalloprotease FtsH [Candidatus Saccharibacteria bacterium]|nr:ATP-dependent zinc metalloprotease FtsH [Candidatus Saccharibacteria bacterium]MCB9817637.1 ATP-dependent zinc metalloprotease FtsH [Candidatus Nomurabacteria bacterium]HPD98839.1 ATP-dependent zinc metalloprotease FtsH [Candidatus Saccharibacteria bacterium]HPR09965.1 ATP-dependent zinc metalloprotease FtsH [Candidatus Saccharibacteria bacterium]